MAKGRIFIETDRCKGCSLCIAYCPVHILKLDDTQTNAKGYTPMITFDPDKCIACGFCAMMCPDSVIRVEKYVKEESK